MPHPTPLHGVFLGSHAVSEGWLTRRQLQSGVYRRLLHNVYADPGLALDHRLVATGAALVLPSAGAIGGRSAAAWYGAPFASVTDPVTVLVPRSCPWRGPRGVRVHRTDLALGHIRVVDGGVRITDATRTAWDVATLERTADAVATLDGMMHTGQLAPDRVAALERWATGQWRGRRARKALTLADGRAESPPESWLRVAVDQAGLEPPIPQYVVVVDGQFIGRVDLAWPRAKLVVEYEGPHHFEALQIAKDDRRYQRLVAAGWRVIRLSAADLRDMDEVVGRIRQALAGVDMAS